MCLDASLLAILLIAASGVPGLGFGRQSSLGQWIASCSLLLGALVGAPAALGTLTDGRVETAALSGPLPELTLHLRLDPLAAFFLIPIYVLGAVATLYGIRYWKQAEHPGNGRGSSDLRLVPRAGWRAVPLLHGTKDPPSPAR